MDEVRERGRSVDEVRERGRSVDGRVGEVGEDGLWMAG